MSQKFYLTLDTETATFDFADSITKNGKEKQTISIMRPLVYDIGWVITDSDGKEYKRVNYLVQETFFVPQIFSTAYYKEKRPKYMEMYNRGIISAKCWNDIAEELKTDLDKCDYCVAYNGAFDYKKAIPFTELYMEQLYSATYYEWAEKQKSICEWVLNKPKKSKSKNHNYTKATFKFRGKEYPMIDLWGVACSDLINNDEYKDFCLKNNLVSESGKYFKTSAETTYQFLKNQPDFVESHTALDDALIEAEILDIAIHTTEVAATLYPFPFRKLGTIAEWLNAEEK